MRRAYVSRVIPEKDNAEDTLPGAFGVGMCSE